jgi:phage-related protein
MAAGSAVLAIKIIADASQAVSELSKTGGKLEKFQSGIGAAALPATAVVGALGAMTVAAAEDAAEQKKLQKVYENATGSTDDYTSAIDAAIAAGQDKAFTDSDVRKGLQPLITATGNAEEANKLLGPAMDIARLAGVDLETASDALAKAHAGQATSLQKLIPGLEKTKDPMEAIANATAIAAGQAEEYAASGPGQLAAVADAYGELGETIGTTFLPALDTAAGLLKDVAGFLDDNMAVLQPIAAVIGAVALAILGLNVALWAWNAAAAALSVVQGILNVVMAANPVVLVVLAILALIAAFVLAYKNSETFRNIVDGVFKAVVGFVRTAIDTISGIFSGILAFLRKPWEAVQPIIDGVFKAIGDIVKAAIDIVSGIFDTILAFLREPFETFQTVVDTVFGLVEGFVKTAIDAIALIFSGVEKMLSDPWTAFQDMVKTVMDTVTGLVRSAVDVINGILDGIRGAIQTVSDAVDAINPFATLPPAAPAPATSMVAARRTAMTAGARTGDAALAGSLTVNVYGGDPWRIEQAVRRGYRGWTAGAGVQAPRREY